MDLQKYDLMRAQIFTQYGGGECHMGVGRGDCGRI